ncbi:MAG: ABC transporter substrate-binding protein [Caldilineales bacterium]|nr:ABC transporter substrate-binding protein [Caldilineales bacterium]
MTRKSRKTILLLVISFVSVALLIACAPPVAPSTTAPSAAPTKVMLGLGFIPSVQFAPFYVAIDQGYFADENIEVELEHGFETDFLKLLGTNERQFIVASGEEAILGRAQGLPVNYVANWYRHFPVVIFAKADSGIAAPADLIGKKVGLPGLFGASYIAWKGLVSATDLAEDQVDLESIGFTQAAAVSEGLVDAALDYAVNGPVQLRLAGDTVNIISVDDYLQLPANGLFTNETVIAENPELVEGMVRALLRGIRFTLDNPDEAFEISLKFVPEAAQQRDVNRAIFDASLDFWQPGEGETLGLMNPDIWPATAELMAEAGLVDKVVDTDGIWVDRFVRAAAVE